MPGSTGACTPASFGEAPEVWHGLPLVVAIPLLHAMLVAGGPGFAGIPTPGDRKPPSNDDSAQTPLDTAQTDSMSTPLTSAAPLLGVHPALLPADTASWVSAIAAVLALFVLGNQVLISRRQSSHDEVMLLNDLVTSWNADALRRQWLELLEVTEGSRQPSWEHAPCAPRKPAVALSEDQTLESVKAVVRFLDRVAVLLLQGRISSSLVHEMLGREFYSARAAIRTLAEDWTGWGYWINTGMRARLRILEDVVWAEAVRLNTVFPPQLAGAVARHKRSRRSGVKARRRLRREARALGGFLVANQLAARLVVSEVPAAGRRFPPSIALAWCYLHRNGQRLLGFFDRRRWAPPFEEANGTYRVNPTRAEPTTPELEFGGGTYAREIYRGKREIKAQMWWTAANGPVTEENFVIWSVTPASGTYAIEAYIPKSFASAKVRYRVIRRGVGPLLTEIDQEKEGGRWVELAPLITVGGRTKVRVRLSDCGDERRKLIGIGPIRLSPRERGR